MLSDATGPDLVASGVVLALSSSSALLTVLSALLAIVVVWACWSRTSAARRAERLRAELLDRDRLERELRSARDEAEEARRDLEESIERAGELARRAEAASRAKSEILASVSREIRTPLNGIVGMLAFLKESTLDDEQREFAETAHESAVGLLDLLTDVLDGSRIELGELDVEAIEFDLRSLLDSACRGFEVQARERGLDLDCRVSRDVPSHVRGDPGLVRQMLSRLVGHTVRSTDGGRIDVAVSLESEAQGRARIEFLVERSGARRPTEDRTETVDDPGREAPPPGPPAPVGPGLTTARALAERLGGHLRAEDLGGETVALRADISLEIRERAAPPEAAGPDCLRGLRVLVVDGSDLHRRILVGMLGSWECRTQSCADTEAALDLLRVAKEEADPVRVAVVERAAPGDAGESLVARVKDDPDLWDTHLVLVPSCGRRGDLERIRKMGCSAYLTQPVEKSDLRDCILTLLGRASGSTVSLDRTVVTRHSLREDRRVEGVERSDAPAADLDAPSVDPRPTGSRLVWDRAAALERLGGDTALVTELVEAFLHELPDQLRQLDGAAREGQRDECRRLAHGLRGSAACVGAPLLQETVRRLERVYAEGDLEGAEALRARIDEEATRFAQAVEDARAAAPVR